MRLKAIRLSGFKSFVDPTTVSFSTNMTGIVGPNGCGKSNTIDAVRWVMGESSAKYLRGDAMTDVIFNGSTERKPVGKASVELQFDNTDRTLRGEYAAYNEISVRRQVTREGQSQYFLNGSRCRRRDITDLFLGTGLGPRSYAIIEQGMISRLIEAKPDELRVYVEEAAGISRYKDRRRETENRMRRTRENLERLDDIREELDRQLVHLQKQAEAAEKYKALKADERQKKAELMALKWRVLDNDYASQEAGISQLETRIEGKVADQTGLEARIEATRLQVIEHTDTFQDTQTAFYELGTRIARQEQKLESQEQLALRLGENLAQIKRSLNDNEQALTQDEHAIQETREQLLLASEELAILTMQQEERDQQADIAETQWANWQENWHQFTEKAGEPARKSDVCKARILSLQQQLESVRKTHERRVREMDELQEQEGDDELMMLEAEVAELDLHLEAANEQLDQDKEALSCRRQEVQTGRETLEQDRRQLTRLLQRKATLEALQTAALADDDGTVTRWLESHQMARHPRLASRLHVETGWEIAVETVLGQHLTAVVVDHLDELAPCLVNPSQASINFWETNSSCGETSSSFGEINSGNQNRAPMAASESVPDESCLLNKVSSPEHLAPALATVKTADHLDQALAMRTQLNEQESIVLQDGTWIGRNWLRVPAAAGQESGGLLLRQQELEQVTEEWDMLDMEVEEKATHLDALQLQIHSQEQQLETASKEVRQRQQKLSELTIQEARLRANQAQRLQRRSQTEAELSELEKQRQLLQEELEITRMDEQEVVLELEAFAAERNQLQDSRATLQQHLDQARQEVNAAQHQCHQQQLTQQQLTSRVEALEHARQRLEQEKEALLKQQDTLLASQQQDHQADLDRIRAELQQLLAQRVDAEHALQHQRQLLEEVEQVLKGLEEQRQAVERQAQDIRTQLEAARLECQALDIRRQTLIEQLSDEGFELRTIIEQLSNDASIDEWQQALTTIGERIRRLGNINLAAIEECQQQTERKQYLDTQYHDLLTALSTLEGAIVRIDQETRARFSQTFDSINSGLTELFPKVFGGGSAWLELTDDDLLTTGVAIMARPPGKKNSTIHLLSGGEKALTAIALVFSIFQLNPAPFCMLDEVDAPLDDANVGRYGRLVKAMSDRVQFIYITHNKIAMEMASQLLGVTMQEPGVSRLVSVNVEEAADMMD